MPTIKKKYRKQAGELNHKIEIKRKTVSKPINGIIKEEWNTIYSPHCNVSNNTGKEYIKDGIELYGLESKSFIFRSHPTIKIKQKDIIIYDGERYEIVSSFDYDDLKMFTKVIAKKCEQ